MEKSSLLDGLQTSDLQDIVRYLCCVESKGKGDTYSSHSVSKRKMKERMAEVQWMWTKYFNLPPIKEEEEEEETDNLQTINENDNNIDYGE